MIKITGLSGRHREEWVVNMIQQKKDRTETWNTWKPGNCCREKVILVNIFYNLVCTGAWWKGETCPQTHYNKMRGHTFEGEKNFNLNVFTCKMSQNMQIMRIKCDKIYKLFRTVSII